MQLPKRKIINDPVHGFITIDHPLLFNIIAHPYYQRLRRIHQMAMAHLVYPGAVHTRLHHSLGAYHLVSNALSVVFNIRESGMHCRFASIDRAIFVLYVVGVSFISAMAKISAVKSSVT